MGRAGTTQRSPSGDVVEVNQAVVRGRTVFFPGEVSPVRAGEKSAEVIVVRDQPGADGPFKLANGQLDSMKD